MVRSDKETAQSQEFANLGMVLSLSEGRQA